MGELTIRNKTGQAICTVDTYRTDVRGIVVHVIPQTPWLYTVSHISGLNFGGTFASIDEAREAVADHFQGATRSIDWMVNVNQLRQNQRAYITYLSFREKYTMGIAQKKVQALKRLTEI